MTQARALVEAWKKEQAEKKRMHKMGIFKSTLTISTKKSKK
jgi:hypothetical protein